MYPSGGSCNRPECDWVKTNKVLKKVFLVKLYIG